MVILDFFSTEWRWKKKSWECKSNCSSCDGGKVQLCICNFYLG